jgi:hypothetical protein
MSLQVGAMTARNRHPDLSRSTGRGGKRKMVGGAHPTGEA